MIFPSKPEDMLDAVGRQANDWVRRIAAGDMTHVDADALRRWCAARPEHAAAFASAQRLWEGMRAATEIPPAPAPLSLAALKAEMDKRTAPRASRRAFFVGAGAAGIAAAGAALMAPPFGLWPSLGELRADYRTGTGERRQVALAGQVKIDLSTRTSIALRPASADAAVDLIDGETAVDTLQASLPFTMTAASGMIVARAARFDVRRTAAVVCVTCLAGEVRVAHAFGTANLSQGQQVTYDRRTMGVPVSLAADDVPEWREGFLRFRQARLTQVIDEINRYRPGRVVLLDDKVAEKPVSARFKIDDLDTAIAQIQEGFGLKSTTLPGGVVLLT
jgi:transmembrane sensor